MTSTAAVTVLVLSVTPRPVAVPLVVLVALLVPRVPPPIAAVAVPAVAAVPIPMRVVAVRVRIVVLAVSGGRREKGSRSRKSDQSCENDEQSDEDGARTASDNCDHRYSFHGFGAKGMPEPGPTRHRGVCTAEAAASTEESRDYGDACSSKNRAVPAYQRDYSRCLGVGRGRVSTAFLPAAIVDPQVLARSWQGGARRG